jgi:hypothetical protein
MLQNKYAVRDLFGKRLSCRGFCKASGLPKRKQVKMDVRITGSYCLSGPPSEDLILVIVPKIPNDYVVSFTMNDQEGSGVVY